MIADKEDKREQLIDTLETHKYHFEQVLRLSEGSLKALLSASS